MVMKKGWRGNAPGDNDHDMEEEDSGDTEDDDDSDGDEEGRRGNVLGDNLGSRESSSGHDALLVTRLHWGKHRQHRRHHHLQIFL